MDSYDESVYQGKVDAALRRVRMILDATRNPQYPADVPHRYDDKFHLVEFLTRVAGASLVQCLGNIGLTPEGLAQLRDRATTRSVTLRLGASERCTFAREETRKVESAQEHVTETRSFLGGKTTKTEKVITTVTEYFWRFELEYSLFAFQGTDDANRVEVVARKGQVEIKTAAKTTPRPQSVVRPSLDLDLSWLLRHLDAESRMTFAIDRTVAACHTPRRNDEVDAALRALEEWFAWCGSVHAYFQSTLFPAQQEHGLDLSAIHDGGVFVPVVALFEGRTSAEGEGPLPLAYAEAFLVEEQRSLAAKCRDLAKVFPRDGSVITAIEASLLVILLHARQVCQQYANGVGYVEQMLEDQLIAAIGKELTPADFTGYMDFHHRKLLRPEFRPRPFSHAIRRPDHYPEGVLSLEAERGGSMPDPISTSVAWSEATRPMSFALDASTRVSFTGDRFLHAWMSHEFSGASGLALSLVARARQFSSFVLLVGRIASADAFEPRFAVIVQNKDLLKIPLMLEQIPTPKEFRDAIESLSPEQQRFAKAFRGMQLESTLFGVCVIQIKPQLEKLLKLEPDSLTKEIKLTQDLLSLFIEYQIPSDLLAFDGPANSTPFEKIERLKEYVRRMQEMIDLSRAREIEEAQERERFRLAEANRTPVHPPPGMPPPGMGGPMGGAMPMGAPPPMKTMMGAPPMPSPGPPPMMQMPSAPPSSAARPSAPMPAPVPAAAPPQQAPAPAPVVATSSASPAPTRPVAASHGAPAGDGDPVDYTRIPGELDKKFEQLDEDGALRPAIIHPGDVWSRTSQKGLLAAASTANLYAREQKTEKNRAFDLLDALSKSGAIPVEHASLHVILAATHCFDKTLLDTVIQDNINPIEKVERSMMIVATTVHRRPALELLADDQRDRFLTYSPRLGPGADEPAS